MTYTITQFGSDTTPALPDLDQNFNAVFLLTPVPCAVAGTNTLALTQNIGSQAASGVIAAYANGLQLCGVAAQTNSGSATAALGSLAALNIYKDSITGPVALSGNEIVQACAFTLRYDSALNTNAGGWHLIANITNSGNTITPALVRASVGLQIGVSTQPTLAGLLQQTATLTYTSVAPNASQDQSFTVAGLLSTDGMAMSLPIPNSTGLTFSTYFAAGNATVGTVTVRCANVTAASTITPGAMTVNFRGIRTI